MNDKFFFGEELQCTVSIGVDDVSKAADDSWEDGDDRAALMVVRYMVDLLANRKFCHRDPLRNH